jgi:ferredoxin
MHLEAASQSAGFRVGLHTPDGLKSVACGANEYVWDAAARQDVSLPAICHQGRCLTCASKLVSGSVDQQDADSYFPDDRDAGFILLCRAKPLSNLEILTHQEKEMRVHRLDHGLPAPYA